MVPASPAVSSLALGASDRIIFNPYSFMLYPLFKRFTHWPQAWLGLAMNSGLITAWIATTGFLDFGVLSAGMFGCWW